VPTPFYHLSLAEEILDHSALPVQIAVVLHDNRPAFLLGCTAPDVQTISGQTRPATHFFDLPIQLGDIPAWKRLLATHPALSRPDRLPPAQAAFLAGYLSHLQADWLWIIQIFAPIFGPAATWRDQQHRIYLHNVLRSYLDLQIVKAIPSWTGSELSKAIPDRWLPFAYDYHLQRWRDFLAEQMKPGSVIHTVEVFAARQGIPVEAYYQLLNSETRLDQEIFSRIPRQFLENYRQDFIVENLHLLQAYFNSHKYNGYQKHAVYPYV
jgi:hypothetical protein